jgi:hypothetical protein
VSGTERLATVSQLQHRCRSCQAPIVWAHTTTGKRIPVDAAPAAGGNIRLIAGQHGLTAHVVGSAIDLFDDTDTGERHLPHHATCPQADEWRNR